MSPSYGELDESQLHLERWFLAGALKKSQDLPGMRLETPEMVGRKASGPCQIRTHCCPRRMISDISGIQNTSPLPPQAESYVIAMALYIYICISSCSESGPWPDFWGYRKTSWVPGSKATRMGPWSRFGLFPNRTFN